MLTPFQMNGGFRRDHPIPHRVGDTLQQRAWGVVHSYRLLRIDDCTTRRGVPSKYLTWLGGCALCGQPFLVTSSRRPASLQRTCPAHRGQYQGPMGWSGIPLSEVLR
jgi:hypothetical protein